MPLDQCPVYCRFCTRSYAIGLDTAEVEKVHLRVNEERWRLVQRAHAFDNHLYTAVARNSTAGSSVTAPWGEILAEGGVEPGVFLAEIDTSKVDAARKSVPSLQHGRRFGIADPKAGPEHLHLVRGSA